MNSRGIVVRGVTIEGAAASGIFIGNTHNFTVEGVIVRNARASSIYITEGSSSGNILRPQIFNSGSDGVAFLSRKSHGVQVKDMFLQSPKVKFCSTSRAFSVVGCSDIIMNDLHAEDSDAASLYIAAESSVDSYGVSNVKVNGGVLVRSNRNRAVDHGSILVYNGQPSEILEDITINNIRSENTNKMQPWEIGIITAGSGGIRRVEMRDIIVTGGPSLALYSQAAPSTYRTERIVQDGQPLPDSAGYAVTLTMVPSSAPPLARTGRNLRVHQGEHE